MCESVPPAGAHPARLALGEGRSLPVLVLRARGPNSYTGEPAAEILLPSNPTLIERVSARLLETPGVRPAGPGEFTARAYLNGRLSLDQAEGVAARIAARTDEQLAAAAELLSGRAGERARAASDAIATLLALVEAGVDFTDEEDVQPIPPPELSARLAALQSDLHAPAPARVEGGRPIVVLAGRASVGKSTLFNALLGRPRAVTHAEPGTTRDVLTEPLDVSPEVGAPCVVDLADAAGLELDPTDRASAAALDAARAAIERADLVVHCDDRGAFAGSFASDALRVRTKADRAPASDGDALAVCALDGFGLPELRAAIADRLLGSGGRSASGARVLALPEHRRALAAAAAAIDEARSWIDPAARALHAPELVAGALRAALDALAPLAGRVTPDDVLGRVFASFCIGK